MSETSQNISLELPAHLLEKLGNDPADKIRELVEKYIEQQSAESSKNTSPKPFN